MKKKNRICMMILRRCWIRGFQKLLSLLCWIKIRKTLFPTPVGPYESKWSPDEEDSASSEDLINEYFSVFFFRSWSCFANTVSCRFWEKNVIWALFRCVVITVLSLSLTLNVPTTHICVEIYDVILTRNCGELLGLGHWCFISNDLT